MEVVAFPKHSSPDGAWLPKYSVVVDNTDITELSIEQCLNLAAKNYLCYVSWLRMCQLFTVLTGVIFQC